MCVYVTIIATILAVMLWCMDSAVALKCNGNGFECSLAGHTGGDRGSVHWRGRPCM